MKESLKNIGIVFLIIIFLFSWVFGLSSLEDLNIKSGIVFLIVFSISFIVLEVIYIKRKKSYFNHNDKINNFGDFLNDNLFNLIYSFIISITLFGFIEFIKKLSKLPNLILTIINSIPNILNKIGNFFIALFKFLIENYIIFIVIGIILLVILIKYLLYKYFIEE